MRATLFCATICNYFSTGLSDFLRLVLVNIQYIQSDNIRLLSGTKLKGRSSYLGRPLVN